MAKTKYQKNGPHKEWVGTLHAALALGCSVQTLYRWANTKTFPDSAVRKERYGNAYDVEAIRSWAISRAPNRVGRPFIQVINAA